MRNTAKFVRDENIRRFQEKLKEATDPVEIKRLEDLIETEERIYAEALRASDGRKREA